MIFFCHICLLSSPLMKNTAHFAFLKLFPSVAGDRDVVCDLLLVPDCFRAYKLLPSPLVVEKNPKCDRRRAEHFYYPSTFGTCFYM